MADLQKRKFGRTDFEVSVLGFGGAPIGVLETDQPRVERILNLLLDEGVNLLDTAAMYRGSEEAIGKAVAHRRNEYFLVSKCGQAFEDLPGEAWSAELITHTVERALRRLQTDHLDLMLLHTCDLATLKQGEALEALVKARDAGKVRHVGYSGDNEAARYAATLGDVAVIQSSVNICDQVNIHDVLPLTQQNNVGVMAKRPIANAAWKKLSDQPGMYSSYAETYTKRFAAMGLSPADLGFSGDAAQLWPEISLRFTLSQPGVHTAIIGTTSPDHVRANLEAAAKEPLPDETVAHIRAAFQQAEAAARQKWTGQT
jgi:aryl-alcohol dehydrogenase-like predicted oxidoreductase